MTLKHKAKDSTCSTSKILFWSRVGFLLIGFFAFLKYFVPTNQFGAPGPQIAIRKPSHLHGLSPAANDINNDNTNTNTYTYTNNKFVINSKKSINNILIPINNNNNNNQQHNLIFNDHDQLQSLYLSHLIPNNNKNKQQMPIGINHKFINREDQPPKLKILIVSRPRTGSSLLRQALVGLFEHGLGLKTFTLHEPENDWIFKNHGNVYSRFRKDENAESNLMRDIFNCNFTVPFLNAGLPIRYKDNDCRTGRKRKMKKNHGKSGKSGKSRKSRKSRSRQSAHKKRYEQHKSRYKQIRSKKKDKMSIQEWINIHRNTDKNGHKDHQSRDRRLDVYDHDHMQDHHVSSHNHRMEMGCDLYQMEQECLASNVIVVKSISFSYKDIFFDESDDIKYVVLVRNPFDHIESILHDIKISSKRQDNPPTLSERAHHVCVKYYNDTVVQFMKNNDQYDSHFITYNSFAGREMFDDSMNKLLQFFFKIDHHDYDDDTHNKDDDDVDDDNHDKSNMMSIINDGNDNIDINSNSNIFIKNINNGNRNINNNQTFEKMSDNHLFVDINSDVNRKSLDEFYQQFKDDRFLVDCENATKINSVKFTTVRCVDQRLESKQEHLLIKSQNDFNGWKSFEICKPYLNQFNFKIPSFD